MDLVTRDIGITISRKSMIVSITPKELYSGLLERVISTRKSIITPLKVYQPTMMAILIRSHVTLLFRSFREGIN